MHIDYQPDRDSYHGEHPKKLAKAIVHETPLDFVALSEHNQASESYFRLREQLEEQSDVWRQQHDTRREIWLALGLELSVTFEGRRYHLGYVYEDMPRDKAHLPEVPERGIDITGKDFEHFRLDYPGVAILNHPTWKDRTDAELRHTAEFMRSKLIDGAEIGNGCIVSNGKNGSGVRRTRESAELFVAARAEQESEYGRRKKEFKNGEPRPAKSFLAPVGSSDAHRAEHIGTMFTAYHNGDNPYDGFFQAVRSGSTKVVPGESALVQERMMTVLDSVQHARKYIHVPPSKKRKHRKRTNKKKK